MNSLFQKTKKITAIVAVLALLFVQNSALVLGLGIFSRGYKVDVVNAFYNSSPITLANSNFENPTSSNYPITPSSFTKVDADASVTSGLINVSQSVYDEKYLDYKLNFNPETAYEVDYNENKVLMINAESTNTKMGYQSSSFVLAKNGYYTVEVLVFTQNTSGITANASLYLTGDTQITNSANSKMLAINTQGIWKKYTFYVETSEISDKTLNLELYLGAKNSILSQGAVFFDNVKIMSHSHDMYYTQINNLNYVDTNYSILNLKQNKVTNAVENGDFENSTFTGWEVLSANNSVANSEFVGAFYVDNNFGSDEPGVDTSPTNANFYNNQKALLINNVTPASIGFRSSDILIEQHKLYKLNVWVKTGELENGANIKLIEKNPYGEDNTTYTTATSNFDSIKTTATSNEKYENWVQYSYLIKGGIFLDSYVNLELWLGTETQSEAGYVFFDNVELYELTTSEYNSITTNTTVKQVTLSESSSSPSIANGNFNDVIIEDVSDTYPHTANNWTITSNSENYSNAEVQNGVINTKTSHFNANSANYSFVNPGNLNNQINDEISNNVLVVGNITLTSQIFTSESKSLEANSYYLLTFYVQTQGLSSNAVSVQLLSGSTPIYNLHQIESNLSWTKYSVYFKTGLSTIDAKIQLLVGNKTQEVTGHVFFDNVSIANSDSAAYSNATEDATNKKYNFAFENFVATDATSINGLYTPQNFVGTNVSGISSELLQTGVLNTDEFNEFDFVGMNNPLSASEDYKNVLMIGAHDDAYYAYTSSQAYTLSANKHYKFTVYVKTQNLSQQTSNQIINDDEQIVPFGVSVALDGFDNKFSGINTQVDQITSEYVEYSFYVVSASDKTTNLILSLGDTDALTKGYAFFSNISLSEINETAYSEALAQINGENPPSTMLNLEDAEVQDDDEDQQPQEGSGINFDFLLFPTLMFGLALIIAILGYSIRQIKFNRIIRRRIKTEIYDRNRTLSVDHERREVVKERQERLLKLKEQLGQLQLEIEQNEQAFKLSKQEVKEVKLTETEKVTTKDFNEKQLKAYKQKQKDLFKKQRQQEYLEKRERLQKEFDRIEKEIEKLEREERLMFEKYRNYKAQVKALKLEIKQKTKDARIKRKLKRKKQKERNKK